MVADPTVLQSFLPRQLIGWLAGRSPSLLLPRHEEREVVTWFADLSGFSRLTHEMTDRDRAGPELVGRLLNEVFGGIIDKVTGHGGDVLEFAGDSVLATWAIDDDPVPALALASRCGLEVLDLELPVDQSGHRLDLRIGIGIGTGVLLELGGVNEQWHFVMGGAPFTQIRAASAAARPGEVVLSPPAAAAIGSAARGRTDTDGFLRLVEVDAGDHSPVDEAAAVPQAPPGEMRRFLPPPVLRRIDAGHSDWLAEFRQVSSVFVNLPGLEPTTQRGREAMQDVVVKTQEALLKYEGTLMRVLDDDKGVTLFASFGLPPYAHEEDPYLAVQTAEEIQGALTEMRLEYGIGIATGRAFCGAYGSPERREYTTIGQEVNLAARLMQAASFEILCDQATVRAARRIQFNPVGERRLRGWEQPVAVFRPLWEKAGPRPDRHPRADLVGRESEQTQLIAWLGALVRAHSSAVVVVEGEAGIGKSALAADLIGTAATFDVRVLTGAALPVAQAPFQAWRDVIADLLEIGEVRSLERRQEVVREKLAQWPQFAEWEALLNSVLDLRFPETASTRGMSGGNRRESTVELLVALLVEAATRQPLLVVLDDVQWFDSASWAVTLAAARKVSPMLLVLLTRPVPERPEQMEQLVDLGTSGRLVLQPLSAESSLALARERLGADELGPGLTEVILEAAEGVPFFVEELAYSLRDSGSLVVDERRAELALPADRLGVPHTLSSVVLGRIDRLSPEMALTLKVASVIGRSFDTRSLSAAHPAHPGTDELDTQLRLLEELGLIVESAPGSYDFRHALTRDTAYDLLVFDQRRQIHRSVAQYLESLPEEPGERLFTLLAYHWDRAEDRRKALTYLEKTGASALRRGANREAIEAHGRSLELLHRHPDEFADVVPLRQSQWHLEIGQAHEASGNFEEALSSFYRALDMVGVRVSPHPLRRLGRLLVETFKQLAHIVVPGAIRTPTDPAEKARLAQAARIASLIGETYYFTGDLTGFPALNLVAINLGEKSGEPMVAGLAYSSLGYLVGSLRLRRLADRYFRRARAARDLDRHPRLVDIPYVLQLEEMGPGHLIAVALTESVLALTFDEWEKARDIVTDALRECDRLGDKYSAGIALAVRGFVSYSSGDIEESLHDYNQLLVSARQRANREHEGWATSFVTPVLLALNRLDEAQAMSASAVGILSDVDPLTVPVIHGTRSQVLLRSGHPAEAQASAEAALEAIDRTPIFIYLAAYAGLLDTLLDLWAAEGDRSSGTARELARLTRRGLSKMRIFAWLLPFARPKYWLLRGRMQHQAGRPRRAQRSLRRGLAMAEQSGFVWDVGLLHLELARITPPTDPGRNTHLEQARRSFQRVGSRRDLDRVADLAG